MKLDHVHVRFIEASMNQRDDLLHKAPQAKRGNEPPIQGSIQSGFPSLFPFIFF